MTEAIYRKYTTFCSRKNRRQSAIYRSLYGESMDEIDSPFTKYLIQCQEGGYLCNGIETQSGERHGHPLESLFSDTASVGTRRAK